MLLTKVDLLPHLPGFRMPVLEDALARTMPRLKVIRVSAVTGEGLPEWIAWLEERRRALGGAGASASGHAHAHHGHGAPAHSH